MRIKYVLGLIALVLVIAAVAWLGGEPRNSKAKIVKVGVITPLTGQFGGLGEGVANAIRLAEEEFERSHDNVKVELVVEDGAYDAQTGIAAYRKLTQVDHVDALILLSTPLLDAMYKTMQADGLPVMTIGLQSEGVVADNIFQLSAAPDLIIKGFSQLTQSEKPLAGADNVAIVYSNNAVDTAFEKTLLTVYSGAHDEYVVTSSDEYPTIATKIAAKADQYDAVVLLTLPSDGANVVKNLNRQLHGKLPQLVFDAQLQTGWADYQKILGDTKVLNGAFNLSLKSGDNTQIASAYKARYAQDMPTFADYGYDTFNILMNAYDSNTPEWLSAIGKTHMIGQSGTISFDQDGVRIQDVGIFQVVNGETKPTGY